jgi:hypothetical protein
MGERIYTMQIENVAVAAVQDIFSLKAGAGHGIEIRHIMLGAVGQTSPVEFRLSLKRFPATVTQGSGGSTPTINQSQSGDTKASGATGHANDTSQMSTSGTAATLESFTWDVLLPFEYVPGSPEERDACIASEGLALTLNAAPASTNISGFIKWSETP